jgi:SAM-dependent methyltransferase
MPTLPRQEPHQARRIAESFGGDVERYDRARPPYPDAMVDRIVAASPGRDVLDVGTGTGIAARQFQAAGCTVLGVEPDPRMAGFARRGGLPVEVATFEAWDPAGRTFDAVVAGTAWHWIDPVAGAAMAAEALRPGGRLAPFWHVFEPPPAVADAMAAALRRVAPDSPANTPPAAGVQSGQTALDRYQPILTRAADGMRAAGGFDEPEQWRYVQERRYRREAWLDLVPTFGGLASHLAPDDLTAVLDGIGAAIDAAGGEITVRCYTAVVTATRSRTPRG